ncbi:hypothetical protein ASD79_00955 [Caulobacter sp. Root655]|nr:hypothetical protein ASD79_00955 [Caulobacter sp. Root655]
MRILFLDHAFHRKTGSSRFFLDFLKGFSDVTLEFFDPLIADSEIERLVALNFTDFDLVVVWQLEALAFLPISVGASVLVIPMYDGSGAQPAEHWAALSDASILNFSYNLHVATRELMASAKVVQYFPDPKPFALAKDFERPRVFFWHRRGDQLDLETVFRLLPGNFESIHVHIAPDDPDEEVTLPSWASRYGVTSSRWFDDPKGLSDVIDSCNVAVCPRFSEGIGMFMLEAMARGMCVIGSSWPVHNEYIANNINGMLFDPGSYGALDLSDAERLGTMARKGVEAGRLRWEEDLKALPAFVAACATLKRPPSLTPATALRLVRSYFEDMELYRQLASGLVAGNPAMARALKASRGPEDLARAAERQAMGVARQHLESLREGLGRIPGWRRLRALLPSRVKIVLARLFMAVRR